MQLQKKKGLLILHLHSGNIHDMNSSGATQLLEGNMKSDYTVRNSGKKRVFYWKYCEKKTWNVDGGHEHPDFHFMITNYHLNKGLDLLAAIGYILVIFTSQHICYMSSCKNATFGGSSLR